jgi:Uma2 family endonuclease
MISQPGEPLSLKSVDRLGPMLTLPTARTFTPEEFAGVCAANPDAVLELDADGHLIEMSPTGSDTSARNSNLIALLWWAVRRNRLSLKVFDSSGGFRLPDGSVRSPDASVVRLERWEALSQAERRGFAPLCPDLVVELASPSDDLSALRRRMVAFMDNGASLGWLLLPETRTVEIWSARPWGGEAPEGSGGPSDAPDSCDGDGSTRSSEVEASGAEPGSVQPGAGSHAPTRRQVGEGRLDAAPFFPGLAIDLDEIWEA